MKIGYYYIIFHPFHEWYNADNLTISMATDPIIQPNPETIEKHISIIKALFTEEEEKEQANLSTQLVELRHHVLFVHEQLHDKLQYLLTKSIYRIKKPRKIPRFALKMFIIAPVMKELGYKQTVDAAAGMGLLNPAERQQLMKVNGHRNKFGHRNQHEDELKEYEKRDKYLLVLLDLLLAKKVLTDAFLRQQKSRRGKPKTLSQIATYVRKESNKNNLLSS